MTRIVTTLVAVALLALAPIGFAQEASELDVSEAEGFMGMWSLSFESDQGPFDYSLDLKDMGGKVAATLNNDFLGESMVTDITKVGDDLNLKWEGDMQGQLMKASLPSRDPDAHPRRGRVRIEAEGSAAEGLARFRRVCPDGRDRHPVAQDLHGRARSALAVRPADLHGCRGQSAEAGGLARGPTEPASTPAHSPVTSWSGTFRPSRRSQAHRPHRGGGVCCLPPRDPARSGS